MSSRLWEYWQVCTYTLFFSLFSTFLQVIAHLSRKNSNEHYRQTPSCWITSPMIFPLLYRHALQNHDCFATWNRSLFFFLGLRSNFHSIFIQQTQLRFQSSQLHWTRTRTSYEQYCLPGISKSLNYTFKKPISAPFPLLSDHNHKWLCVDQFGKKCPIDMCWTTGSQ